MVRSRDMRLECGDIGECSFLTDADSELEKHQQLATKNQNVILAKFDLLSKRLVQHLGLDHQDQSLNEFVARARKLKCERDSFSSQINETMKECAALSSQIQELPNQVIEKQNEVRQLSRNLEQLKSDAADSILDSKECQHKFKLAFDASKMAKKNYKDALGCHVSFLHADGDNVEFLLSFNKTRPPTLVPIPPNSIKFQLNRSKKLWKVLETNPPMENFKQLALKLDQSQDIQGFLAYLQSMMHTSFTQKS